MTATLAAVEADFRKHFKDEMKAGRPVTPGGAVRWAFERITTGADEATEEKRGRGRPTKKNKTAELREKLAGMNRDQLRTLAKGKVPSASKMGKDVLVEALVALGVDPE